MGMFVVAPTSSFHHHPQDAAAFAESAAGFSTALGVGVIPLLSTPCLAAPNSPIDGASDGSSRGGGVGGIHLWHNHQQASQITTNQYLRKYPIIDNSSNPANPISGGAVDGGGRITASATASGVMTCLDCGNQAKKDCSFRRCRTCCKSRGFDCATHVKSTWVPASRRRERQIIAATGAGTSTSTSGTKKPRLSASQNTATNSHTSNSNTTPPRSFDTSGSSRQDPRFKESLPGQVRAPAVFKCVRVTAVEDGEDEYAYQAVVRIGGHVFKGFLYDQGIERQEGLPNLSDLHLGSGGGRDHNAASSSYPIHPSSNAYATQGSALLGGLSYGNSHIN
ncbi:hypothetical protein SAY87_016210 [Trapa incisa]|uniref:Uncharacterized protein n=2 Tax=Trapa TaxID=22665 RepID=A0AAN7LH76_TRANT|nr:hypothetical protein SAY87_016210 [Trapa incisa]KAK4785385.1 hypothetical protein SAY86_002074 [Trapa natans]